MTDWKDILKPDDAINEQDLMLYLKGKASEEARQAIEEKMAASDFLHDAIEGLQQVNDPTQLDSLKNQLNLQLNKTIRKKNNRKKNRKSPEQLWLIIAVLVILGLSVAGYLLIHFYNK